jgi:quercetin dioxygenase-like cupin family protein
MLTTPLIDRLGGADRPAAERPAFVPHPSFAGVRLARLVDAEAGGGALSTLLVALAPGARMLPHRHDHQTEQHLVLAGAGRLDLDGRTHEYRPGSLVVVPEGHEHSVTADEEGMMLLAVFSPAA